MSTDPKLHDNPDAQAWAEEFTSHVIQAGVKIDEALMLAWFANAIMAGHDAAMRPTMDGRTDRFDLMNRMQLKQECRRLHAITHFLIAPKTTPHLRRDQVELLHKLLPPNPSMDVIAQKLVGLHEQNAQLNAELEAAEDRLQDARKLLPPVKAALAQDPHTNCIWPVCECLACATAKLVSELENPTEIHE